MPFLRGVRDNGVSIDLRSSKALVGSSRAKCDVVLPTESGVLDLHALLTLSSTKSEATIVPFISTAEGACFLNGRVVPADGATVVHGDRVAFGNAENAFLFMLTEEPPGQQQRSQSFRRTLDALRGDRRPQVIAKAITGNGDESRNTNETVSVGVSRERLEKLLLNSSTDSLLGDYVERQLRKSVSRRERVRPAAMEPPPSLSASTASSIQSALADSILDRSAQLQTAAELSNGVPANLAVSQSLLSTAERNYAEIEKLRLSQRLREVNNVLNGHLDFRSSYLSTERRNCDSQSIRRSSTVQHDTADQGLDENADCEEESLEDEDDELPAMVEKPQSERLVLPNHASTKSPTRTPTTGSSPLSPTRKLSTSVTQAFAVAQSSPSPPDTTKSDALDESLPSFSEAIQKPRIRLEMAPSASPLASEACDRYTSNSAAAVSSGTTMPRQRAARTQLHQQLIDRTLKHKRQEILVEGFVRWRQGIRVQEQRRRVKTRQMQIIEKKLQSLRRNHTFLRWKHLAEQRQQALQCREEAFAQRRNFRLLRDVWTQWVIRSLSDWRRKGIMERLILLYSISRLRTGFGRWKRSSDTLRTYSIHRDAHQRQGEALERRMEAIASRHHQIRSTTVYIRRVLHTWWDFARRERIKSHTIRRILLQLQRRHQLRAWATWKQHTTIHRHAIDAITRRQRAVEEVKQNVTEQYNAKQGHMRELHEKQVDDLQATIAQQAEQLEAMKQERLERERKLREVRAVAYNHWQRCVERFLETSIAQADTRIATLNGKLELWLQQMDGDPQSARFQCASFLVEEMIEQKLRNANELVDAKTTMASTINGDTSQSDCRQAWRDALPGNVKYLLGMVNQRHARLQQLYQAVSKLSASVPQPSIGGTVQLDPVKFKHATFLTDTIKDRMASHLEDILDVHHCYRKLHAGGDHVEAREARKY